MTESERQVVHELRETVALAIHCEIMVAIYAQQPDTLQSLHRIRDVLNRAVCGCGELGTEQCTDGVRRCLHCSLSLSNTIEELRKEGISDELETA